MPPLESTDPLNVLITGAAGFIGSQLATRLLSSTSPQYRLLLTDLIPPNTPPNSAHDDNRVATLQGDITSPAFVAALLAHPFTQPLHAAFVLHGLMSGHAEADPALSLRVNVDSVRLLADALQDRAERSGVRVRLVYTSSLAVFGPPFPDDAPTTTTTTTTTTCAPPKKIPERWSPTPQSTYGAHKLLSEIYLNEAHRRTADGGAGLDVFVARLPTVAVRPGRPSGAASSFLSGIIREPMNGAECVVPVRDRAFRAWLASPATVVENLVRVLEMRSDVLPRHVRQIMFPGVSVSVQELRDALARYGGEDKLALIREEEDEEVGRILKGWAQDFEIGTALRLGLVRDEGADEIVRQYVESLGR
ncbi:hypothetical protein VTK26DRAFT_7792 [Humicola hyalothermophila]